MLICGIIKPHAIDQSNEILGALRAQGVIIKETKIIQYTNLLVQVLYDHMSECARSEIAERMVGKIGIAVLLEVPNVEWLLEVVGAESNPHSCKPNTIRVCFGMHSAPTHVGGEAWWENAFHRPVDEREAQRDLRFVFPEALISDGRSFRDLKK